MILYKLHFKKQVYCDSEWSNRVSINKVEVRLVNIQFRCHIILLIILGPKLSQNYFKSYLSFTNTQFFFISNYFLYSNGNLSNKAFQVPTKSKSIA